MLRQFFSVTVAIELSLAATWFVVLCVASRYYSKAQNGKPRSLKADYLKAPTSTALTVLGLLLPILVALTSYLYTTRPTLEYGSLLTTIVLYFVVLLVAIWETFAILKKADDTDIIQLTYPTDRRFITALGLMYGGLLLGLFFFAYFFLFEIRPAPAIATPTTAATQLVQRTPLMLDMARDDVHRLWGIPSRSSNYFDEYDGDKCKFVVVYDHTGKILKLTAQR